MSEELLLEPEELELFDDELEPDLDRFLGLFFEGGSSSVSLLTFSAGLFRFLLRIFVLESLMTIFRLLLHS